MTLLCSCLCYGLKRYHLKQKKTLKPQKNRNKHKKFSCFWQSSHNRISDNSKSSWMSYLKGGAENILKEAKSASEKVVGAVVQASK